MTKEEQDSYELYDARMTMIEQQWVPELVTRLGIDKSKAAELLSDWVYSNTEPDYLKLAAESDHCMGDYGGGDLPEFLRLATEAWQKAWGKKPKDQAERIDNLLDAIEDLIDAYRDQTSDQTEEKQRPVEEAQTG